MVEGVQQGPVLVGTFFSPQACEEVVQQGGSSPVFWAEGAWSTGRRRDRSAQG